MVMFYFQNRAAIANRELVETRKELDQVSENMSNIEAANHRLSQELAGKERIVRQVPGALMYGEVVALAEDGELDPAIAMARDFLEVYSQSHFASSVEKLVKDLVDEKRRDELEIEKGQEAARIAMEKADEVRTKSPKVATKVSQRNGEAEKLERILGSLGWLGTTVTEGVREEVDEGYLYRIEVITDTDYQVVLKTNRSITEGVLVSKRKG